MRLGGWTGFRVERSLLAVFYKTMGSSSIVGFVPSWLRVQMQGLPLRAVDGARLSDLS